MRSAPPSSLTILGGGATGLVAAYIAAKAGCAVRVLEASQHPGGLLGTFPIGGTRLEHYYHHFFTHDAELKWLSQELGLTRALEFRPATMGIFRDGQIYAFNGPRDLARFAPLAWPDKFRFALTSLYLGKFAKWNHWEHTPAIAWFQRYAGRAATDAIWRPMLAIKFGPYAEHVPAAWMVGRLRQRMNSRHNGDERLGYFRGSMQVLLDALLERLGRMGVDIVTEAPVIRCDIHDGRLRAVETPRGRFEADAFLSTIPTVHLAPLLRSGAPAYAEALEAVKYFGALCVILELDRRLSDVYWLNVADPGYPFGGVIEHTNLIPPAEYGGSHLVYLSRYFEPGSALAKMSEEEISEMMLEPLPRIHPAFSRKWVRSVRVFRSMTAATVCDLGFSARVPTCRSPLRNLHLATMAHVYPDERSCNNSIRIAAEACRVLGFDSTSVPRGFSLSGLIGMHSS